MPKFLDSGVMTRISNDLTHCFNKLVCYYARLESKYTSTLILDGIWFPSRNVDFIRSLVSRSFRPLTNAALSCYSDSTYLISEVCYDIGFDSPKSEDL